MTNHMAQMFLAARRAALEEYLQKLVEIPGVMDLEPVQSWLTEGPYTGDSKFRRVFQQASQWVVKMKESSSRGPAVIEDQGPPSQGVRDESL
eukprot:CAMPEP_0175905522 /NCGR_PEP_ID=MMETSP0108-20121206/5059_1 /TAXON_ID=195067 ORGANISM="Goniomonas pacifica, Strain CCMP1869" /NCGR_SAMPLE_ID=MMETSP0108 /ASSEMBLY_ACC=CAM_ASM_000204 /LENGTH=91 /DNA_ID=CAMNT_0017227415 /DNA_START=125 /DNA_END=400 /DNA_ORIENTATION=-